MKLVMSYSKQLHLHRSKKSRTPRKKRIRSEKYEVARQEADITQWHNARIRADMGKATADLAVHISRNLLHNEG